MSIERLQSFIGYLRSNKLMEQPDIIRVVRQMQQFDRRIGQLALLRGYMTPEQVTHVTHSQTQINKRFIDMAIDMGFLNANQGSEILKIQKDELFIFCQGAVSGGIKKLPEMVGCLKQFLSAQPAPTGPAAPETATSGGLAPIRAILQKIKGVAPLPGVVAKVTQMLDDPKVSMESVAKIITMDPGLVTTLLRIVNSAFYGLRSQAKTVAQALVVLGTKKVKELVLVAGVMEKFKDIPPQEANRFWTHSIISAQWAKETGAFLKIPDLDSLFISGFIHNVGELVIFQHFPGEYQKIHALRQSGADSLYAERTVLGGTHADISAFLFEIWQFPQAMIQAASIHHHPLNLIRQMSSIKREAMIVHMAVRIADVDAGMDPFEYVAQVSSTAGAYGDILKLEEFSIEDTTVKVREVTENLRKMMNISSPDKK